MYMVNNRLLLNNLYAISLGYIKIDGFNSVWNVANQNLLSIFYAGNIVELKAIDRVISLVQSIFHRHNITQNRNNVKRNSPIIPYLTEEDFLAK